MTEQADHRVGLDGQVGDQAARSLLQQVSLFTPRVVAYRTQKTVLIGPEMRPFPTLVGHLETVGLQIT